MGTKSNPGKFDCYHNLQPDEPYFVLMGRDKMAGQLVDMWATGALLKLSSEIEEAKAKGASITDIEQSVRYADEYEKIAEAKRCAVAMTEHCRALGKIPMRWNAKAPVLSVSCDVTKEEVERVLNTLYMDDYALPRQHGEIVERMARALRILP